MKKPEFSFEGIAGHSRIKQNLLKLAHSDSKPNAMVFSGPEGVGKLTCASAYAAACLCQSPGENGACGECHSCRCLSAGTNLDIFYWFRKKQNTTIDQMRQLTELASYAPAGGRYKINIIQDGDSLNEEASNSILKTIEDSPEYLITIIIYNNPGRILPTIRSRSFSLRFQPLDTGTVESFLGQKYPGDARIPFAARASGGSIGKAEMLLDAPCAEEARDIAADLIFGAMRDNYTLLSLAARAAGLDFNPPEKEEAVKQSSVKGYVVKDDSAVKKSSEEIQAGPSGFLPSPFYPEMTSQESITAFLELVSLWLRDILLIKTNGPEDRLVNTDRKPLLSKQAGAFKKVSTVTKMIEEILEEEERLRTNVNAQLSLEGAFCRLYGICRRDRAPGA
ncbi:MAG: hypothetical protein ILO36_05225 [Abditibacteriota bacterium]|nr:hypothetical protein [Abditibacteriota bacterium]